MNRPRDAETDFLLTMALDIHDKDLICTACGGYVRDCQSDDAEGHFEPDDSTICYRTAAREEFLKENPDLESGTLVRFVDTRIAPAPARTQHNTSGKRPEVTNDGTLG